TPGSVRPLPALRSLCLACSTRSMSFCVGAFRSTVGMVVDVPTPKRPNPSDSLCLLFVQHVIAIVSSRLSQCMIGLCKLPCATPRLALRGASHPTQGRKLCDPSAPTFLFAL